MGRCEQMGETQRRHLRPRPPEGPSHLCRKSLAAAGLGTKDKETSSWTGGPPEPLPGAGPEGPSREDGKWTPPQSPPQGRMAFEVPPARHNPAQATHAQQERRGRRGSGRPRGGESWPRPPPRGRGFIQGSPTKRRRTPRFQSHFKSDYHTGPSVLIIDFHSFYPGEGNGNPLQHSCLETPMDRGVSQATVHGVARARHD